MTKMTAAIAAATKLACAIATGMLFTTATPALADWNAPWKSEDKALVIDAYEFNPINWEELSSDDRIAGFINKASDGLPPEWNCNSLSGDDYKLCKNRWWKYSVTKELYMTRREMAKMKGLKWGAYHLARPGNPREQADHFIEFAEPEPDDLIAIDIEDNSDEWMSLEDAEIFADQIKIRTGRYPVLYTNGSTAQYISDHKAEYPLLSKLPLWYARYRDDITGKFPEETWPTYALWQFSSMHNCNEASCPYRVKGAETDIDVNVSPLNIAELKAAWPFNELIEPLDAEPDPSMLIAEVDEDTKAEVATIVASADDAESEAPDGDNLAVADADDAKPAADDMLVAAYAPTSGRAKIDPLKLLTEAAYGERHPGGRHPAQAAAPVQTSDAIDPAAVSAGFQNMMKRFGTAADAISAFAGIGASEAKTADDETASWTRSRFLEIVLTAEARKEAGVLPMPAYVLSQAPVDESGRGPRLTASDTKTQQQVADLERADSRILGAFEATR